MGLGQSIGHVFGLPAASKPSVSFGIAPPGRSPPHFAGGGRMRASVHGAVVKYGSSACQPFPAGDTHTCTFDEPRNAGLRIAGHRDRRRSP